MLRNQANRNSRFVLTKIIIIFILPSLVTTTVSNLLLSDTSATIINPSGAVIKLNNYWENNDPNHFGNGAHWICGIGHCLLAAAGNTITFETNFDWFCSSNLALVKAKAEDDDGLEIDFNGNAVIVTSGSSTDLSQSIPINCGPNNFKAILTNHQLGGMGVVYSITQEQTGCTNCCTDNMPFCIVCQSANYCITCQYPELSMAPDHSACINCTQHMPNCATCTSTTYCSSCLLAELTLAADHSACLFDCSQMPNCATCTSTTSCSSCLLAELSLAADHSACINCSQYMPNCGACSSITYCTSCLNASMIMATNHS